MRNIWSDKMPRLYSSFYARGIGAGYQNCYGLIETGNGQRSRKIPEFPKIQKCALLNRCSRNQLLS